MLSWPSPRESLPGQNAFETALLIDVARWAQAFLTQPHPALGRSGPVCPYVRASIQERHFLLTVLTPGRTHGVDAEDTMLRLGRYFLELEPKTGRAAQLKTIVVLFPHLTGAATAETIEAMHLRLKPHFLWQGLMLGEFFENNPKSGLHNAGFKPLRSKIPLLVIRSMVETDIAFLTDDAAFVVAFLDRFRARGCAEIRNHVERRKHSLSERERTMLLEQVRHFETTRFDSAEVTTS